MSIAAIDDLPYISNEDVNILYDIVSLAETSSAPPFRALFAAYDQVLKQHGIEAAKDQLYFRFLLRMREEKKSQRGLVSQFQCLLGQLGIHLDFGDELREEEYAAANLSSDAERDHKQEVHKETDDEQSKRPTISRRASFSSFQENTSTHLLEAELNKRRNRPRSIDFDDSKHIRKPITHSSNALPRSNIPIAKPTLAKSSKYGHAPAVTTLAAMPLRQAMADTGPVASYAAKDTADLTFAESEISGYSSDLTDEHTQEYNETLGGEMPERPDMIEAAKSLRFHQVAAQCTRLFREWALTTQVVTATRAEYDSLATSQYHGVLCRSVIQKWSDSNRLVQQQRETEIFFETLEIKTAKARSVYLLTKAFTHWAACAEAQVLRTSAARRHILRTRYFNAWRDITVVNEMKIRRLGLSKFFDVWKRKTVTEIAHREKAEALYARHVGQAAYNKWFWTFCERRAPGWCASKLKISFFERWAGRASQVCSDSAWARDYRQKVLLRWSLAAWMQKAAASKTTMEVAAEFRWRRLTGPCLEDLRREAELGPTYETILSRVDSRILGQSCSTWREKTQMYRQSRRIDHSRVLRNAWTAWNDQLRCQNLQHTISDRIKGQALYRWVLAERSALKQRLTRDKTKEQLYVLWKSKAIDSRLKSDDAERFVSQSRDYYAMSRVFMHWSTRIRPEQQNFNLASDFQRKKCLRRALSPWLQKFETVQLMKIRAKNVSFFVATSPAIKQWRKAIGVVQQNRRREAYALVRQRVKQGLARNAFFVWRGRAAQITDLQMTAKEMDVTRFQSRVAVLFESWYSRTLTIFASMEQAIEIHEKNILIFTVSKLSVHLGTLQTLDAKANAFSHAIASAAAASAIRQVSRHAFQLKRNHETAESAAQRMQKRHYKSILKWWAAKARSTRHDRQFDAGSSEVQPSQTPFQSETSLKTSRAAPLSTVTAARRHVIAAFDLGKSGAGGTAQTPGYLKTPSRHQRAFSRATHIHSYTPAGLLPIPASGASGSSGLGLETPGPKLTASRRDRRYEMTPFLRRLQERGRSNLASSVGHGVSTSGHFAATSTELQQNVTEARRSVIATQDILDTTRPEIQMEMTEENIDETTDEASPLRPRSQRPVGDQ